MTRLPLVLLVACSPAVTQEAQLRDPRAVTVLASDHRVLLAAGDGPEAVADPTSSRDPPTVVARDADGALSIGERTVVDASGTARVSWPANTWPALPPPSIRDGALHLTVPRRFGRSTVEVFAIDTPLANVTSVREVRAPSFNAFVLGVGIVLVAGGTTGIVVGSTRAGWSTSLRASEIGVSAPILLAGLGSVGLALYGLLAPRTDRVLFRAPP